MSNATTIVQEVAAMTGVPCPTVVISDSRNASYNSRRHLIHVSRRLVGALDPADLRALLAHEVFHATQRRALLFDWALSLGLAYAPLASLLPAAFYLGSSLQGHLRLLVLTACAVLFSLLLMHLLRPWFDARELAREIAADAYAEQLCGRGSVVRSLRECSRIEDGGMQTEAGRIRIAALQK